MLFLYTILFFISTFLYFASHNYIASGIMIALAIFLFIADIIRAKRIVNIRAFFALGFIGGFGLSLLKLSNLSKDYSIIMFFVIFVSYFCVYLGVFFADKHNADKKNNNRMMKIHKADFILTNQEIFMILLFTFTFMSFILEALILKFIPVFTIDTPHAYSTFHVFGLHYITTLYIFIPSIAICNCIINENKKNSNIFIFLSFLYVIIMAVLMVSRAQLITSVVLALFTLLISKNYDVVTFFENKGYKYVKISNKKTFRVIVFIALGIVIFILLYVIITINRAHNIEYLNSIFDMKNKNIPIFITQPYMYIAHNFENLNYLIDNIFRFTFGRRVLYPLFTLTLVKKFFPIVTDSPYYIIKNELSTTTLVYDFYYDFAIAGVIIFCFIIGYVGRLIENKVYNSVETGGFAKNNYIIIILAQLAYYMIFSFFQAYFSLTDTWVNLIFLVLISVFFVMNGTSNK